MLDEKSQTMMYVNNEADIMVPIIPTRLKTTDDAALMRSLNTERILTFICSQLITLHLLPQVLHLLWLRQTFLAARFAMLLYHHVEALT